MATDKSVLYDEENPKTSLSDWDGATIKMGGKVIGNVKRGEQKSPRKIPTTIRLSPDVVEYFKTTGSGWQTRLDDALRDYVKVHSH